MYTCLHHQHRTHFGQAQGSPATEHPISKLFGEDTNTQFGEVFQQGLELQCNPSSPSYVDNGITVAEVKAGFKIWKEWTSTSLPGWHLGLYKVWLQKANKINRS
eukprot:13618898-Ditylum_brightwellii.AAC.1